MRVTINDRLPQFSAKMKAKLNIALNDAARDILIDAKNTAPYKGGGLRGGTDITTPKNLTRRISFWVEYARFQEFGGDRKRVVRNYTTPGTGKKYLSNAGKKGTEKFTRTVRKYLWT